MKDAPVIEFIGASKVTENLIRENTERLLDGFVTQYQPSGLASRVKGKCYFNLFSFHIFRLSSSFAQILKIFDIFDNTGRHRQL